MERNVYFSHSLIFLHISLLPSLTYLSSLFLSRFLSLSLSFSLSVISKEIKE